MHGSIRASSIFGIILYILLLPFYIYGFLRWYQWRAHPFFLLRYAYPEGLGIVILSIIIQHIHIARHALSDMDDTKYRTAQQLLLSISLSLGYMMYGLIYYRANLIFLTWRLYQRRLHEMGIMGRGSISTFINVSSPRRHWSSKTLLAIAYIGGCLHFVFALTSLWSLVYALWFLSCLILFIIVIVVKLHHVKELVGCLYETYLAFAVILLWFIFVYVVKHRELGRFIWILIDHSLGLITIYFALYFVYKAKLRKRVTEMAKNTAAPPTKDEELQCEIKKIDISLDESLQTFLLHRTYYEILSRYLAQCFCLETLLFISRVCVLRWVILTKMHHTKVESLENNEKSCYVLQFLYLEEMYKEYNDATNTENNDFAANREALWTICHNIYNEFVCADAINLINIPFEVTHDLKQRLQCNDDMDRYFQSYDDFLSLFTDAVDNVWHLLHGVYQFKFASYIAEIKSQDS